MKKILSIVALMCFIASAYTQNTKITITKEEGTNIQKQVLVVDDTDQLTEYVKRAKFPKAVQNQLESDFNSNYSANEPYMFVAEENDNTYSVEIGEGSDMPTIAERRMIRGKPSTPRIIKERDMVFAGNSQAYLGLGYDAFDHKNDTRSTLRGVVVKSVVTGEAAYNAGLQEGDVITAINGVSTPSPSLFLDAISDMKPRDAVTFTVDRNGSTMTLDAIAGKKSGMNFWQGDEPNMHPFIFQEMDLENMMSDFDFEGMIDELDLEKFENFDFENMMENKVRLGVHIEEDDKGVMVKHVEENSAAAKAGIIKGDVITTVDGEKVDNPDELIEIIQSMEEGDQVKIKLLRDNKKKTVTATLEKIDHLFYFQNLEGNLENLIDEEKLQELQNRLAELEPTLEKLVEQYEQN